SQYTRYLEAMPDTLAHELSNPLNVVNSSLENLEIEIPDSRNSKYMARAKNGIVRLRSILTSLTEAANLEDALQTEEQEKFDFVELVTGCVDGYKVSNPDRKFDLDIIHSPLLVLGSADHLAQMLDKLADNAVDFSDPDTTILVRLQRANDKIALSITNEGPLLPEAMKDRLFDPMISVGKKKADKSHLGLGLFITRLITQYHKG
ncbi:MAG: sensor histidine kinase, partial [Arenicellales bacterium WSBS_2016_MAG_OTU3]